MSIQKRVLANVSSWVDLAEKGEITWEQASIMVNSFELGMAEFAEEAGLPKVQEEAYQVIADTNKYIELRGQLACYPPNSKDFRSMKVISRDIQSTVNLKSRRTLKRINDINR